MHPRALRKYTFTVLTDANSQTITLNDNQGRVKPQSVLTLNDPSATWFAIRTFARRNGIRICDVGYSARVNA